MNTAIFENLLRNPESEVLDFKRCQYNLLNDVGGIKTADFVKDIVCFCNTIRSETAYIIIGVECKNNSDNELIGIDMHIDDAIFQDKIKNKVTPNPTFACYTFNYLDKKFGIIEIPVVKYSEPISSVIRMKGLEIGKIYFRRNSSNSEATGREIIKLHKWLESLPEDYRSGSFSDEIADLISKVTSPDHVLSDCVSQVLQFSNKFGLLKLKEFCTNELTGWWNKIPDEEISQVLSYRMSKVVVSPLDVELNGYYNFDSRRMIQELKKINGFIEQTFLFPYPITEIEKFLNRLIENKNTLIILKSTTRNVLQDNSIDDIKINIFANRDNIDTIYSGIRQKLLDILVSLY